VHYNSRSDEGSLKQLPGEVYRELEIVASDVCDAEAMNFLLEGAEGVLHLAALIGIPYSYLAPSSYVRVNVQGTVNLLNAARRADCRIFVQTSTSEVYGSAQYVPMDEDHPVVAQSPYAGSKIAADKMAESFARSFKTPVVILRPFNTYGPRQSLRAVIPTLAAQLLDSRAREVHVGNQSTVRDFTFVSDTVNGFLRALEAPVLPGEVINLGTGTGYTIADIYDVLQQCSGVTKPIIEQSVRVRPESSEVTRLVSNNEKARNLLGWRPTVCIEVGCRSLIAHLQSAPPSEASRYYV